MEVRTLLHKDKLRGHRDLIETIAVAQDVPLHKLLRFEDRPLRVFYTEGFCQGALPFREVGQPWKEVQVPLAPQSTMFGVRLAAAGVRKAMENNRGSQRRKVWRAEAAGSVYTHPGAKDPRGKCLCQDQDYVDMYQDKNRE